MAMGENALMMATASIWGVGIGLGISYLFNGIFMFISLFTGGITALTRAVMVPFGELAIISGVTFFGMLFATVLSVRSAANQDLAVLKH